MILSNPTILGGDLDLAIPPGATGLIGIASPSSTDNAIVRWDGTAGDLVQNSVVTIADTTGAIAGCQSITGGAANMTITSGTGNSRTLILQTTTSGGTATTALTLNATQDATLVGDLTVTGGSIGVGIAASTDTGVLVTNNSLTGTSQFGLVSNSAFTSAANGGDAYGALIQVKTAAAAFTLAEAAAVRSSAPSLGGSSAITTLRGLYILNQGATGITNAYGVDIAAQSGASAINVGLRNAGTSQLGAPGSVALTVGGAAAAVTTASTLIKTVGSIADAAATAVLTVTIPNAAHSASLKVRLVGSLGAGGAIGANEATGTVSYDFGIARTAGVNAVTTISTAYGSGMANVAGAATITVTAAASAIAGAVGDPNTFTVNVTITRGSGSSTNHTCVVLAELVNANATGVSIA